MNLLEIALNINKTHQGRIPMRKGTQYFSQGRISTHALHAFLGGASRRARGSGFSAKFFNLEHFSASTAICYYMLFGSNAIYLNLLLLQRSSAQRPFCSNALCPNALCLKSVSALMVLCSNALCD